MKSFLRFVLIAVLAGFFTGCEKPDNPGWGNESATPRLTLMNTAITFEAEGGTISVSFLANMAWTASSDQPWLTLNPASGSGAESKQSVSVVASANTGAERTAKVTFRMGELSAELSVSQKKDPNYIPITTLAEFRKKPVDETTWYKISGVIVSQPEDQYGNFFIVDETSYVYVYGLCEKQVGKGGNDQSFSKLGLKPGDTITMMSLRSVYNDTIEAGGQTPAYFVSKTSGNYTLGKKMAVTTAKWMELPATSATDGQDLLIHCFPDATRSYAAYWDYKNFVSSWVAYPLHSGNIGSGGRTADGAFPMDPLLSRSQQPYLPKGYVEGNAGKYDRGHQIPSADRLDWRVNLETFFSTNMTPQDNGLNAEAWERLENKVRSWARSSETDTLYVVTGCSVKGSTKYCMDADDKKVTVPVGYYKALLRLAKDKSYSAVGFWFNNEPNSAGSIQKSMSMSIDALEEKVGVDFFVNLPDDVEKSVEAQNPAEVAWWWNN